MNDDAMKKRKGMKYEVRLCCCVMKREKMKAEEG